MYGPAMSSGITPDMFWELSAAEIAHSIRAKQEYDLAQQRNYTRIACNLAYNTGWLVAMGVNAPKSYPKTPAEAFPELFGGVRGGIPVSDWQASKQAMAEYAAYSRRRRVNDG